jgi:O-antigen/teichoic acid export membrane protein
MSNLGSQSLSAIFWGGGGSVIRIGLQIATQIVLSRILGPDQFGLFAIGAVVIGLSNFLSSIGIAYGLIQKEEISAEDLRFVFTWQVVLGVLVSSLITLLSGPIAEFFGNLRAQPVVAGMAVICLINALTSPASCLLTRDLNFKRIQIANIVGYVIGYVFFGIPMAMLGATVWALVTAWITQSLITLAITFSAVRHPLRPLFWFDGSANIVRYGATVFVTNITNWVIGNIERVVIGRYFLSRDIGLYATAYNFLYGPVASLLGIVQPVFFSATSRISSDQQRIVKTYIALTGLSAVIVLPLFSSIATIAPTFILAIYGAPWIDAAELVRPLAMAMPFYLFWGFTTPLLWVGGAPEREFKVQLPMAVLWIVVSWLAAHQSVLAVAWSVAGLFVLRYALIVSAAWRLVPLRSTALWRALRGGVFLALLCSAFVWFIDSQLHSIEITALIRLVLDVAACTLFYFILLTVVPGLVPPECAEIINRLSPRLPSSLARWTDALVQ